MSDELSTGLVAERYSRQVLFPPIGEEGQRRLTQARVALIGCGALGSVIANTLVRAGIGFLRVCDRDYIELNNLQRQVLFDESDVAKGLPKAVAAAERLRAVNPLVEIDAVVRDVNHRNIERLVRDVALILDGTDNFETRYLINDASIRFGIPWIYGAAVGSHGLVMPVLPGQTLCLRCVFEEAPPPELSPTCDTAGIIAPTVNIIASLQCVEALKILTGRLDEVRRVLTSVDVWAGRLVQVATGRSTDAPDCPCCTRGELDYLDGRAVRSTTVLCGRDAVQVSPAGEQDGLIDLSELAEKLAPVARVLKSGRFMLVAEVGEHRITVFADGRAIIKGTRSAEIARSLYARYIGA